MPPKFKRHLRSGDLAGSNDVERVNLLGEYHDDDEEEDFFYERSPVPKPGQSNQSSSKVQKVQSQVDEVVGVMRGNMEKVMDRGEKLEDLEDKTDADPDASGGCYYPSHRFNSNHLKDQE
ncbi:vesicle-associated membrane protein 4 isoform X2 [Strongylocentrotus purpuratus]|uniref:V-SNARE coiled-coil homology domain-containing protein n=1 Tax=Strongylocentrotus purpuratus TaxID=7668 RepID=A0A7M7PM82_STRPU|nr:vesicle-associated membrane protein 4 isoform X2 [Strongylocentrotus purpuratus]